jgi:hypothetical protein
LEKLCVIAEMLRAAQTSKKTTATFLIEPPRFLDSEQRCTEEKRFYAKARNMVEHENGGGEWYDSSDGKLSALAPPPGQSGAVFHLTAGVYGYRCK